jgi:hypothetical protein
MIDVGWLQQDDEGRLSIPNFDYHNSETAKTRAMSAKRQDRHRKNRDKSNAESNASCVTEVTDFALPEKRREERNKTITQTPVGFAEFWSAYPKKIGKGNAEKAWEKHRPDLAVCLAAVSVQSASIDWLKDNGQFIPHPATWINQRRWEDVPTEVKKKPFDANAWLKEKLS